MTAGVTEYNVNVIVHGNRGLRYVDPSTGNETIPNQIIEIGLGTKVFKSPISHNVGKLFCVSLTIRKTTSSTHQLTARFTIHATLKDLKAQLIDISALHSYFLATNLIGKIAVSLSCIHNLKDHRLPKSWQKLWSVTQPNVDVGWICVSIEVLAPFERGDDLNSTSMAAVPIKGQETNFQHYLILFSVHAAEDLIETKLAGKSQKDHFIEVVVDTS